LSLTAGQDSACAAAQRLNMASVAIARRENMALLPGLKISARDAYHASSRPLNG